VTDLNIWFGVAALLSLLIFATASWMLHKRLRNRHSFVFLLSVLAFVAWVPTSSLVTMLVIANHNPRDPSQLANWVAISSELVVPALILLIAAASFLLAVRSIAPQPNNSFKPNPLRGSA
jgi:hypothetical protein